jgi:hypothetical protein
VTDILWLFERGPCPWPVGAGRPGQLGSYPPLPMPRCGTGWPESAEGAGAALSEGRCPACGTELDQQWTMWVPDQEDLELCIPYVPDKVAHWLGHWCRCCDAGWALVQRPRGFSEPRVVGMLPLGVGAEA